MAVTRQGVIGSNRVREMTFEEFGMAIDSKGRKNRTGSGHEGIITEDEQETKGKRKSR